MPSCLRRLKKPLCLNMYLNKVFLYGNLTRDPEARALPSGRQVVSFGIATNRTYKDKDGKQQEATEFHNIVAFGRTAEVMAQYLKKGRPVFIEGRLQTRSWESDGKKNYRTEIVADRVQFGPKREGQAGATAPIPAGEAEREAPPVDEIEYPTDEVNVDDIPF